MSHPLQQAVAETGIKLDATSKTHWDNVPLDLMLLRLEKLAKLTSNSNFAIQLGQPYQIGWKQGESYNVIFPNAEDLEGLVSYQLWDKDTPVMHYAYFKAGKLLETGPKPETRNAFSSMEEHFETMKPRELFYPNADKGRVAVLFMPLITPQLILNYWVLSKTLLSKLERSKQTKSALAREMQTARPIRLLTLIGFLKACQEPNPAQKYLASSRIQTRTP